MKTKLLHCSAGDVPLCEEAHGSIHVFLSPTRSVGFLKAVFDEVDDVFMNHTLIHFGRGVARVHVPGIFFNENWSSESIVLLFLHEGFDRLESVQASPIIIIIIQNFEEDTTAAIVFGICQSIAVDEGLAESDSRVERKGAIIIIIDGVNDWFVACIIDKVRLSEENSTNVAFKSQMAKAPARFLLALLAVLLAFSSRRRFALGRGWLGRRRRRLRCGGVSGASHGDEDSDKACGNEKN